MPFYNNYSQYYPQYQQTNQMPMQAPVQAQNQSVQNGGFVTVRSEEEARNYPVALGTSVTFMSENSPFVYSKTMGFNQLDRPVFKKYKLVEETNTATESDLTKEPITLSSDKEKAEIKAIWSEIDHIKRDIKNISHRRERKEVKSNE